jgi:hypothetical protein
MTIGCDDTMALEEMKWPEWTSTSATGTGLLRLTDCIPSCASGEQRTYPILARFSRPTPSSNNFHMWVWGNAVFRFPGRRPNGKSQLTFIDFAPGT